MAQVYDLIREYHKRQIRNLIYSVKTRCFSSLDYKLSDKKNNDDQGELPAPTNALVYALIGIHRMRKQELMQDLHKHLDTYFKRLQNTNSESDDTLSFQYLEKFGFAADLVNGGKPAKEAIALIEEKYAKNKLLELRVGEVTGFLYKSLGYEHELAERVDIKPSMKI